MGVPAISYRATVNEHIDYGFYRLPNLVSHQCFDFDELRETLQGILAGKLGAADGDERKALVGDHLAAQDGPLACERMVDILEKIARNQEQTYRSSLRNALERKFVTMGLHLAKRVKSKLPGSHNRPEFQRHRYPGISLEALQARMARMQRVLGDNETLNVEQISDVMFRLSA
jgi:hypothetical protein